jgi:hypothetical protein
MVLRRHLHWSNASFRGQMITIDILDGGPAPKRGDLVHTNIGDRRERTWLVIRVRAIRRRETSLPPRYEVWMERWWQIEPDMRMRLYGSAERAGGQRVIMFRRYPAKKRKRTFEDLMAGYSSTWNPHQTI